MSKILLFDADGVLTIPEEVFSVVYARLHGLDVAPFTKFFTTEWHDYVTGRKDLKEHIHENPDLWQWNGTPDEFLDYWCKTEDIQNGEMIELIKSIREKGVPCYVATEQERYRGEYMKCTMFKDTFDGFFITAEIGYKKNDARFFQEVLRLLRATHEDLAPEDILYFDDSASKVEAARSVGIVAVLFDGIANFKRKLEEVRIIHT